METSIKGFGTEYLTFDGAEAAVGTAMKLIGNGTVGAAGDGEEFIGVSAGSRGSAVLVQMRGVCNMAYTGTAPTVGYRILSANATGGVKTNATGRTILVTAVDSTAKTAEIIL